MVQSNRCLCTRRSPHCMAIRQVWDVGDSRLVADYSASEQMLAAPRCWCSHTCEASLLLHPLEPRAAWLPPCAVAALLLLQDTAGSTR